jgi:membrane-associated phospholipid phosphatase
MTQADDYVRSRCLYQVGITTPESKLSGPRLETSPAVCGRRRRLASGGLFRLLLASFVVIAQPFPVAAQVDTLAPLREPGVIRWWHGAIVLSGLSVLMMLDEPAQRYVQGQRTASSNGLAGTLRRFGQIEVYGTVAAGLVAGGLVSGDDDVTRAGGRLAATLALTGATSSLAKLALGRERPDQNVERDSDEYTPFSGHEAMPSGHSAIAFALATSLSDDIHNPWATVGLYTLASGVAWSRLNDNRHWLSDVAAGAALGIASAKVVNGHWRIFNLRPPKILLGPSHADIAWQVTF